MNKRLLLVLLGLAACGDVSGPGEPTESTLPVIVDALAAASELDLKLTDDGLHIRNRLDEPVYFRAIEREAAAVIFWAPCAMPAECTGVPPRSERTVPLADIVGWSAESKEAIVYWWRLVPGASGEWRVTEIRSRIVAKAPR